MHAATQCFRSGGNQSSLGTAADWPILCSSIRCSVQLEETRLGASEMWCFGGELCMRVLFNLIFGCRHRRCSWPRTVREPRNRTYVVVSELRD